MMPDRKVYFFKNVEIGKKLCHVEFWLIWLKIMVPKAKIGV